MLKRPESEGVEVPYEMLRAQVLRAMIEEFVLREGTDYGHDEYTLDDKVEQVRRQLETGKIVICYDETTESFDLVRKE